MKPAPTLVGLLLSAAGIMTLCALDATAKSLGASISTFEVVFVRYVGASLWLALWIVATKRAWPRRENLVRHAIRGALITLTATSFFYAVTHLPLAVVAAFGMSAPIYISILGIIFLKERASPTLAIAIFLGIIGGLVVVFGGDPVPITGSSDILAWGAAILAPFGYSATMILLKHHAEDEGAAAITLAQSVIAGILVLPLALPGFIVPMPDLWLRIGLIGFLGAAGFLLVIAGLRRLPASVFAIIDYTGLLWAALFGLVFFGEVPTPQLWIGSGLIIAACLLGARANRKRPQATIAS